jgi:hypothetical protein
MTHQSQKTEALTEACRAWESKCNPEQPVARFYTERQAIHTVSLYFAHAFGYLYFYFAARVWRTCRHQR